MSLGSAGAVQEVVAWPRPFFKKKDLACITMVILKCGRGQQSTAQKKQGKDAKLVFGHLCKCFFFFGRWTVS